MLSNRIESRSDESAFDSAVMYGHSLVRSPTTQSLHGTLTYWPEPPCLDVCGFTMLQVSVGASWGRPDTEKLLLVCIAQRLSFTVQRLVADLSHVIPGVCSHGYDYRSKHSDNEFTLNQFCVSKSKQMILIGKTLFAVTRFASSCGPAFFKQLLYHISCNHLQIANAEAASSHHTRNNDAINLVRRSHAYEVPAALEHDSIQQNGTI